MTKNEIYDAISRNPVMHLATVEENQPRVRAMLLYKADETGIYFHTRTDRDVYKQIGVNSNAELCFSCDGIQIRISGALEEIDDNRLKDEILAHPSRQFLRSFKQMGLFKDFYKEVAVFVLKNGTASLWTMEKNFQPKDFVQL